MRNEKKFFASVFQKRGACLSAGRVSRGMSLKQYAIFYHVWCPDGTDIWRLLVDEQLKRVRRAGLPFHADVFCCITGPQCQAIAEFVAMYDWIHVITSTHDETRFEGETLARLHEACSTRPELKAVAYIHTKGIRHFPGGSAQSFRAVNSWRHFLEWGTIDRWRDAIGHLQTVDTVGVNYRLSPWPHFSGNFWWARASYIRGLVHPLTTGKQITRDVDVDDVTLERINYEKWIGTDNPTVFSFYDFPFRIPGQNWTYGFALYEDDIYPYYEHNGI